ncbi:hypothetical protein [Mucilaginibacter flavidus]|uniref:hypothetical protein n=1 Tax=Mucilaginibacter flavidus TaxID=2949309 RepID=UPI0020927A12|nr:hypothetical protein [Mucilaginibacter flavidus]MCO5946947.1 hypothetical protein [Mucilaginibacter flavidus]
MKTKENRSGVATFAVLTVSAIAMLMINPVKLNASNVTGPDTSKKVYNITTFGNLSTTNSSIYVLNGKKISKAEFEKIEQKGILNVSWVSAEKAARVLDNFTSGASVLFVTTKDSDEGKKILAKINKLLNNRAHIVRDGKQSVNIGNSDNKTAGVLNLDSEGSYDATSVEPQIAVGKGNSEVSTVKGYKSKAHAANITSSARPYVLAEGGSGNGVIALVDGKPIMGPVINRMNEKLVIINDKEATADDLKKLSAFDIEKINYKNDDHTRQQYGDKAKKGVVYIYTKKAKQ